MTTRPGADSDCGRALGESAWGSNVLCASPEGEAPRESPAVPCRPFSTRVSVHQVLCEGFLTDCLGMKHTHDKVQVKTHGIEIGNYIDTGAIKLAKFRVPAWSHYKHQCAQRGSAQVPAQHPTWPALSSEEAGCFAQHLPLVQP